MKTITARIMVLVFIGSLVFQGCALNKPLLHDDLRKISSLKVVRHQTPEISDMPASVLLGFLVLGSAGVGFAAAIAMEATKREPSIDLGELVMTKFVERVSTEIPHWPTMTVQEQPIGDDYTLESGTLLEFEVNGIVLHFLQGFVSDVSATMKDSESDVLWQRSFWYRSRDFDRQRTIDEFKADNAKLLREEMVFAAEKTVSELIDHLRGKSEN